jgi:hypothetical protein
LHVPNERPLAIFWRALASIGAEKSMPVISVLAS